MRQERRPGSVRGRFGAIAIAALVAGALVATTLTALPSTQAHAVATPGPGDSVANATFLGVPPARAFDALPSHGGIHYYAVRLEAGDDVRVRLVAGDGAFPDAVPSLVLAGPGLPLDGFRPTQVVLPEDIGARTWTANASAAREVVEAWIPARFDVRISEQIAAPQDGVYYLVLVADAGGPFGLLVEPLGGAPSWTEWFTMPALRHDIALWSGDSVLARYASGALGALAAAATFWIAARHRRPWPLPTVLATIAAAFMAASGALAAREALRVGAASAWLPAAASLAAATLLLALATRAPPTTLARRIAYGTVGASAALAFAGFLWGPVLALGAALAPDDEPRASESDGDDDTS